MNDIKFPPSAIVLTVSVKNDLHTKATSLMYTAKCTIAGMLFEAEGRTPCAAYANLDWILYDTFKTKSTETKRKG